MNGHTMLEEARQICPTLTRRFLEEGALLVDVRERAEVASLAFDVPAIVNIPLSELEQRWSELPKDREIVLVCESGARSLKATYYLQFQGFTRVSNMEGGLLKWMRKGFPVIGKRQEAPAAAATSSCCGSPESVASPTSCCGPTATMASSTDCCSPASPQE
jgi:rhodanese-related sulfurtransferase